MKVQNGEEREESDGDLRNVANIAKDDQKKMDEDHLFKVIQTRVEC